MANIYNFSRSRKNRRNKNWLIARTNELKKRNQAIARDYSKSKKRDTILKLAKLHSLTERQIYNIVK